MRRGVGSHHQIEMCIIYLLLMGPVTRSGSRFAPDVGLTDAPRKIGKARKERTLVGLFATCVFSPPPPTAVHGVEPTAAGGNRPLLFSAGLWISFQTTLSSQLLQN